MEAYGGVDVQIHIFLTSALAGSEWSASRPGRYTIGTHWMGGWVDLRVGLDVVEKRKFLTQPGLHLRSLGRPAHSQPLYPLRCPGNHCLDVCLLRSCLASVNTKRLNNYYSRLLLDHK
jgi:hypothetical protein